jgi:hypothetical protein
MQSFRLYDPHVLALISCCDKNSIQLIKQTLFYVHTQICLHALIKLTLSAQFHRNLTVKIINKPHGSKICLINSRGKSIHIHTARK